MMQGGYWNSMGRHMSEWWTVGPHDLMCLFVLRVRCMSCGNLTGRQELQEDLARLNPAATELALRLAAAAPSSSGKVGTSSVQVGQGQSVQVGQDQSVG